MMQLTQRCLPNAISASKKSHKPDHLQSQLGYDYRT